MIGQSIGEWDEHLENWVKAVLGQPAFFSVPPSNTQTGPGVTLYLLRFSALPSTGSSKRLPLQLLLHYLVITWPETVEGHGLLSQLILAAMDNPDFDVELEPLSVSDWMAFGIKPRPAFVLRVPLRKERPELEQKLVRKLLKVETLVTPPSVHGIIMTAEHGPLVGASIEVPALHFSTSTDMNGRFRLPGASSDKRLNLLIVKARGQEARYTFDRPTSDDDPLIIEFDVKEK